jgi:hypothetical protein
MYQQIILPYTLFPTYLPQAYSLLERSTRRTEKNLHPLFPKGYFSSTERAGAQLYWAGRTMGWMVADGTRFHIGKSLRIHPLIACHFCHAVTHISPFTLPTHKY